MTKAVISGSDVTFGLLRDLYTQLEAGSKDPGKGITADMLRAFLEHRNPFERAEILKVLPYADEEFARTICYPPGFLIRSVAEQVATLSELFPGLDFSYAEELAPKVLPVGAEGVAVVPKLSVIANGDFHQGLAKPLTLLGTPSKFRNWCEGKLTPKHLRLTDKARVAHMTMDKTPGDVWVFPFQFGMLHRGRSVRRARVCFGESEFGLSPYEGAILMLTHPDRLTGPNQLHIDCAGCEYDPFGAGGSSACLYFGWLSHYKCLDLHIIHVSLPDQGFGAATGFLLQ